MKRNIISILFLCLILLTSCQQEEVKDAKEIREYKEKELVKDLDEITNKITEVPLYSEGDQEYFSVQRFFQQVDGEYQYNKVDRTLTLHLLNHQYTLIYGVPVLSDNGWLLPNEKINFIIRENKPYLSLAFLTDVLGLQIKRTADSVGFIWSSKNIVTTANSELEPSLQNANDVIQLLSPLQSPIRGAQVDTVRSHLPGATRAYRNGYHEGMDWYGYSSGVKIDRNTEIFAMGKGIVVRADHNYQGFPSTEVRNQDLQVAQKAEKTPEFILDKLRGRQVWIQYDNGVQARFAHMDRIVDGLKVGDRVNADTLIGYVGNSGTSGEVQKDNSELHLHLDLLVQGKFFWKHLTQDEVIQALKTIFE